MWRSNDEAEHVKAELIGESYVHTLSRLCRETFHFSLSALISSWPLSALGITLVTDAG